MQPEPGILLVDKPKGISSFGVIRILRRELGIRKMGHAGTLDPAASGLMIIGVGPGTKKLEGYIKQPKSYQAEILLGIRTSTGDMAGEILETAPVPDFDNEKIAATLAGMKGKLMLPVPAYSAMKQGGRRLYEMARSGRRFVLPIREMDVLSIALDSIGKFEKYPSIVITLEVESGSYIRSIAEELGKRLGVPATIKELRRLTIGKYSVKDARKIEM